MNNSSLISIDKIRLALIASAFIGVSISYSNFYLFHFVLSIFILIKFLIFKERKFKIKIDSHKKNYFIVLFFILLWYSFSLLWAQNIELGLKYIFYIFCGIVSLSTVIHFSKNIASFNTLFRLLSFLVILEIIIGLFESFTQFRMPISSYSPLSSIFGKDPINFSPFDSIYLYVNLNPPTGFRWNTNDFAISLIIALPFFICHNNNYIKIFGMATIPTLIAMTASRAAFLSLILILSLYLILIKKNIGTLILVWVSSFVIIFSISQFRDSENSRLNELANSFQALKLFISGDIDLGGSIEWRRKLVENGLDALARTNGLGLGAGGTVANQEIIGPVAGRFTSMHNFWVELLVEGGVIFGSITILCIINILIKVFSYSKKNIGRRLKYYNQSLFLSISGFFFAAIAASSTIYFFPMWLLYGFAISTLLLSKAQFEKFKLNN